MKYWGFFLVALTFIACRDDQPDQAYYITLNETEIRSDDSGAYKLILVSSNCDWCVSSMPKWCIAQKIAVDNQEYVAVEILPNDTESSREDRIILSYNKVNSSISIIQGGGSPTLSMQWYTFPVNKFIDVKYELLENKVARKYQIKGAEIFINPSLKNQIFPGNLIRSYTNDILKLTDYYNQYTYNSITLTAMGNRPYFKTLPKPSLTGLNELAQEVILNYPEQNLNFNYQDVPIGYNSYRHLHLLGLGNLGINLDELISGKSYLQKEMGKRTGMIYSYSYELFRIVMDYPEKLINETLSETEKDNMLYVNSVAYGRTALLLIETDNDYNEAKNVVYKIMKGQNLSKDDTQIKNELTAYYIYIDNKGIVQVEKGDEVLIKRYVQEINSLYIMPLLFSTNRYTDNSIGNLAIELELP